MSETPDASAAAPVPVTPAALPPENVVRGTLFALLIVPAGIIAWSIVSALGFISWIVGIGIAVGALALYQRGSGGRISYAGAARVSVIVVVTLVVSFIAGIVAPNGAYFARALQSGKFFEGVAATLQRAGGDGLLNILFVVAFAVVGIVLAFRAAYKQAKQPAA